MKPTYNDFFNINPKEVKKELKKLLREKNGYAPLIPNTAYSGKKKVVE